MTLKAMRNQVRAMRRKIPANLAHITAEEWRILQDTIYKALEPYMEARIAVAEALMQLSGGQESR